MQLLLSHSRKAGLQIFQYDRIRGKWHYTWPHAHKSPLTMDSELLCRQPSGHPSEVSRVLTHLLTDDLVVETQIAGGGSADLSSSIWAKEKDITGLNEPKYVAVDKGNMRSLFKSVLKVFSFSHFLPVIT